MQTEILKDNLITAIQDAFLDVEHPEQDLFECEIGYYEVKCFQRWKNWYEIPENVIDYRYAALSFLSPEGFLFLLPAFMIFAINHPYSVHVNNLIYIFSEPKDVNIAEWHMKRVNSLNQKQQKVTIHFFNFLIQKHNIYFSDNPENTVDSLKKHWNIGSHCLH